MEKHTLKIYDAEATIHEFTHDIALTAKINIKGEPNADVVVFLENGEYVEGSREMNPYYARGFAHDKDVYIIADNINTKQMANLLLSLGCYSAVGGVYPIGTVEISQEEYKEPEYVITAGTIQASELEVKPKKKRSRK